MSKYIKLEEAIEKCKTIAGAGYKWISDLPSIDIVHCSECKHCAVVNKDDIYALCLRYPFVFKLWEQDTRTHYCGFGERKEDDDRQGKSEKV